MEQHAAHDVVGPLGVAVEVLEVVPLVARLAAGLVGAQRRGGLHLAGGAGELVDRALVGMAVPLADVDPLFGNVHHQLVGEHVFLALHRPVGEQQLLGGAVRYAGLGQVVLALEVLQPQHGQLAEIAVGPIDVFQLVQPGLDPQRVLVLVALGHILAIEREGLCAADIVHQRRRDRVVGPVQLRLVHQRPVHDHGHVGKLALWVRRGGGLGDGRRAKGRVLNEHVVLEIPDGVGGAGARQAVDLAAVKTPQAQYGLYAGQVAAKGRVVRGGQYQRGDIGKQLPLGLGIGHAGLGQVVVPLEGQHGLLGALAIIAVCGIAQIAQLDQPVLHEHDVGGTVVAVPVPRPERRIAGAAGSSIRGGRVARRGVVAKQGLLSGNGKARLGQRGKQHHDRQHCAQYASHLW